MRKLTLALWILVVLPLSLHARTWEAIKKAGTIKAAADGATPGFNYFEGKVLKGFEVDLMTEMAKRLGLKLEWVVQAFNTLIIGLRGDRFDVIATSHAQTPTRDEVVDFVSPHYCTGTVIVSGPNGPKTEKELSGKVVAVAVGTVYFEYLNKNHSIKKLRTLPNETSAMHDLVAGKADAWVTEYFVAEQSIQARPDSKLTIGQNLFTQKNSMVVAEGNAELKKALEGELAKMLSDGTYQRLSDSYFGRDIRCP